MTIAGWLKLDATDSDNTIAIRGQSLSSDASWALWRDELGFNTGRVNTLSALLQTDIGALRLEGSDNLLNDSTTWHHVAFVFEAGVADGLRFVVDGQRDSFTTSSVGHSQLATSTTATTLGIDQAGSLFNGSMADVSFWDDALSDDELAQLASGFSPLALPEALDRLVLYQDFVHGLNRPGVGPTVSTTGTFATAPHPRVIAYAHGFYQVMPTGNGALTPYQLGIGDLHSGASRAGALFLPGAEQGTLTPTGEVLS